MTTGVILGIAWENFTFGQPQTKLDFQLDLITNFVLTYFCKGYTMTRHDRVWWMSLSDV